MKLGDTEKRKFGKTRKKIGRKTIVFYGPARRNCKNCMCTSMRINYVDAHLRLKLFFGWKLKHAMKRKNWIQTRSQIFAWVFSMLRRNVQQMIRKIAFVTSCRRGKLKCAQIFTNFSQPFTNSPFSLSCVSDLFVFGIFEYSDCVFVRQSEHTS